MKFKALEIEWLGHAGFLIHSDRVIYIDPYKINTDEKADLILITHGHYDHCSLEDIDKIAKKGTIVVCPADCQSKLVKLSQEVDIKVLTPGKELLLKGTKVKAFPAYNLEKQFHQKEDDWNSYLLDTLAIKIYHAGDTDLIPEMSRLGEIDIALLPVGGNFTMDFEEAIKAADTIRPKIAIPMHYGEIVGTKEDAEKFVQGCIEKGINAQLLEKR